MFANRRISYAISRYPHKPCRPRTQSPLECIKMTLATTGSLRDFTLSAPRLRRGAAALLGLSLLAVLPSSAKADTVLASTFSSTAPGYDPSTGDAWTVGSGTEIAVGFQDPTTSSYHLTQIQVADNDFSGSGDLTVQLVGSATDTPNGGSVLETWTVDSNGATQVAQVYTLTSTGDVAITADEYYFIVETVPDGTAWGWQENTLTPMQIGYWSGASDGSFTSDFNYENSPCIASPCTAVNDPDASGTPAYSVSGTAVPATVTPEPSSITLLGTGLLAGIAMIRRRFA